MSIESLSFQTVAGALGRTLRNLGVQQRSDDTFDPYERAPLTRHEVSQLFDFKSGKPLPDCRAGASDDMAGGEWLERQSLSRIRAALYSGAEL